MSDRQRHGFVLLLVAGLLAASVLVIATQTTLLGLDLKGGVQLVYQARPTPQSAVNQTSLNRAVDIMRSRVDQLGRLPAGDPDLGRQPDLGRAAGRHQRERGPRRRWEPSRG